jgi:hypothetical protein
MVPTTVGYTSAADEDELERLVEERRTMSRTNQSSYTTIRDGRCRDFVQC